MRATITIEVGHGESVADALQELMGVSPCACKAGEPKAAPTEEPEEAPAERPAPESKKHKASRSEEASAKAPAEEPKAEETEAEPAAKGSDTPSREDVRRAAMAAMNEGKRGDVEDVLKAHGGTLKDVPEAELADVLAEIGAL